MNFLYTFFCFIKLYGNVGKYVIIRVQQVTKVDTDSYSAYHGLKFLARRRLVVVLLKVQRQSEVVLLLLWMLLSH